MIRPTRECPRGLTMYLKSASPFSPGKQGSLTLRPWKETCGGQAQTPSRVTCRHLNASQSSQSYQSATRNVNLVNCGPMAITVGATGGEMESMHTIYAPNPAIRQRICILEDDPQGHLLSFSVYCMDPQPWQWWVLFGTYGTLLWPNVVGLPGMLQCTS